MREVLSLRFGGEGIIRVRGIPPAEASWFSIFLPCSLCTPDFDAPSDRQMAKSQQV